MVHFVWGRTNETYLRQWPYLPVCYQQGKVQFAILVLEMLFIAAFHDAHGAKEEDNSNRGPRYGLLSVVCEEDRE